MGHKGFPPTHWRRRLLPLCWSVQYLSGTLRSEFDLLGSSGWKHLQSLSLLRRYREETTSLQSFLWRVMDGSWHDGLSFVCVQFEDGWCEMRDARFVSLLEYFYAGSAKPRHLPSTAEQKHFLFHQQRFKNSRKSTPQAVYTFKHWGLRHFFRTPTLNSSENFHSEEIKSEYILCCYLHGAYWIYPCS